MRYLVTTGGANVNKVNDGGASLLLLASLEGSDLMVRFLVDKGASVNLADNRGRTPLILASFKGNVATVRFLLERGAAVNQTNVEGFSSLHFAAQVSPRNLYPSD